MKLLLLALLAFALVHCQHPYYAFYYPRVMNPFVYYNQMPSYRSVPYNWLHYFGQNQNDGENILIEGNSSDQYELQGDADVIIPTEQSQLRSNSFGSSQQDLPMARFFFNQANAGLIDGSSTSTLNFALKTLVHTTVSVRTVLTTARCIPASLIAFATPCSRRRRGIESLLMPLEPSPPEIVEITSRVTQPLPLNDNDHQLPSTTPSLIASSKTNGNAELEESASGSLARAKRFFIARTTLTSYSFTTSTLKQPVTITAAVNGGPDGCPPGPGLVNCLLSCIPQGYTVC